jgi:hypothetical protein
MTAARSTLVMSWRWIPLEAAHDRQQPQTLDGDHFHFLDGARNMVERQD